jgi:hypothetical protein
MFSAVPFYCSKWREIAIRTHCRPHNQLISDVFIPGKFAPLCAARKLCFMDYLERFFASVTRICIDEARSWQQLHAIEPTG